MIDETIPEALAGERLDRVVALVADLSRADAAALVAAGGATVDGEVVSSGKVRLRAGQRVVVDEAFIPVASSPQPDPDVEFRVVHSDPDLIVIDKPAGLVVHPGAGNPSGTLVNGLLSRFPELAAVGEAHRPGIVHRLDVGTSGLLVVAHSQRAYHVLVDALTRHAVGRSYVALVWGHPSSPAGIIEAPIGRDHRDPMRMAVVVDGKPARTRYRTTATFTAPAPVALLDCDLETGRTHQIRVHLAAIGHPVVGDGTYGGNRIALTCPRPFLHAAKLALAHPTTGEALEFESALPPDLAAVLATLG